MHGNKGTKSRKKKTPDEAKKGRETFIFEWRGPEIRQSLIHILYAGSLGRWDEQLIN